MIHNQIDNQLKNKNMKKIILFTIPFLMLSCSEKRTTQIGENTFIQDDKVFRIIDNQITKLGSIDNDSITESNVLKTKVKEYGKIDISYVQKGAFSELKAVYRGNVLYFKLTIENFNNLRDNYFQGGFTLSFVDEFGFTIHSADIPLNELVRLVGEERETLAFEFNGRTEMSSEVSRAIKTYSLSSSLR